ncbi:MAG: S9 family peptidase, partial [Phaeodactylibacter sp.]|nr:S9 family peptidase [Phaeodactylibacter sp.]
EVYLAPVNSLENKKILTLSLDRSVGQLQWSPEGDYLWFRYIDEGETKVGRISLDGKVEEVAQNLAGSPIGRPYAGGEFAVGPKGRFAITQGDASRPPELASGQAGQQSPRLLTRFNQALFLQKEPGKVEPFRTESSYDGRQVQGWIVYPPDFDPGKKYPLMLEIHGGPYSAYGDVFSMEDQLYASRGYVVVYANPRGSTSYGEEFADLIHHNYPGNDYDDLMSCVDAVIGKGFIDEEKLYVTGGSGGGVLSAWIVGKTDRFRAAVVAKPVINWFSHALTADGPDYFTRNWFPAMPWEAPEHYYKYSPISLVGNVATPTMLLVGDEDHRTPLSESEQFYRALKLRGVDTALVRFPNASHGIAGRPSQMLAKVQAVMAWMEKYGGPKEGEVKP